MEIKRLERQSADGAELNLEALYRIAPSCFTEVEDPATGELRHVVDFKVLRQLLGDNAVEDADEMYQFTWPGKQKARFEAARPIDKTLRPVPEDSLNWDTTQNLYIEGDNLEVLKLLQNSYMGKVKMIYIDPPYNTGNDFVYNDDFSQSADDYAQASGDIDDLGNRYRKNTDSNGRFHSDWCSMIYPRLLIARSLLSEDGVIFISIDDNEVENLKKICNEIFGENNFLNQFAWVSNLTGRQISGQGAAKTWESILVYAKHIDCSPSLLIDISFAKSKMPSVYLGFEKDLRSDEHGDFAVGDTLYNHNRKFNEETRPNLVFSIFYNPQNGKFKTGKIGEKHEGYIEILPHTNGDGIHKYHAWRWSRPKVEEEQYNLIVLKTSKGLEIHTKIREFNNTLLKDIIMNISNGDDEVKDLFNGKKYFDYPKSTSLINAFIGSCVKGKDLVLDFFSGSGTTAHSVYLQNVKDKGNRHFILVQLQEKTLKESEAYKDGYKNICEIAQERIRRAGKKIKEENPLMTQDLDVGFRVFRCDSSNFEDVKKAPQAFLQGSLDLLIDNVKADRTDLDLLFGAMLSWGVELSLPMDTIDVNGMKIYNVNDGDLVACFAPDVTEEVINHMADLHPMRVLFRDSCFSRDDQKINLFETFKQRLDWSEETAINSIRVI